MKSGNAKPDARPISYGGIRVLQLPDSLIPLSGMLYTIWDNAITSPIISPNIGTGVTIRTTARWAFNST